jgi:hypothetical protein
MQVFVANKLAVALAIVTAWSWLAVSVQRGVEEAAKRSTIAAIHLEI